QIGDSVDNHTMPLIASIGLEFQELEIGNIEVELVTKPFRPGQGIADSEAIARLSSVRLVDLHKNALIAALALVEGRDRIAVPIDHRDEVEKPSRVWLAAPIQRHIG